MKNSRSVCLSSCSRLMTLVLVLVGAAVPVFAAYDVIISNNPSANGS